MRIERIEDATLYLGDCREVLPMLDAEAVIVSDPPYGIGFVGPRVGAHSKGKAMHSKLIGDGAHFDPSHLLSWPCLLFGADHYASKLPSGGVMHVWDKNCGRAGADSFSDAELFWTSWPRKREVFRFLWKGFQQEGKGFKRDHPTQKPVELMEFCVRMTKAGTVIDPYMGSGTTGVACAKLGRPFIGVEIEPRYFDVACERIAAAYAQGRLFA